MTVDEPTRHELFTWFAEQMPERLAEAMMKSIPPTGWGDVATRNDLTAHAVLLRGEMAEVRGEMAELRGEMAELRGEMGELRGEMGELRGEMDAFRAEIRAEITTLRADLHGEITVLRSDLSTGIDSVRSSLVRTIALTTAASATSTWGVVVAAIALA